jgi:flagellar basal body-associated protein FliL
MYSCCYIGKSTKIKLIVFLAIGIGVVSTSYFIFTSNNGAALGLSGLLGFAACPFMCAIMGGIMWIGSKFGKTKSKTTSLDPEKEQPFTIVKL